VNVRVVAAVAALVLTLGACLPQPAPPTTEPTPTLARPRFELASYMYALQTKTKIRIGVLDDAAPFSTRDANGKYSGFEPDLGRDLARAIFGPRQDIDSVIEWVSVDRTTNVSALTSLQADVVIARLAVTDEHRSVIDLSDAYFTTGERVVVRSTNDEIKEIGDLETKTVCVQQGSGVEAHIEDANELARTLPLDSYASCLGALQQGQVDAIGADEATVWALLRKDPDTKVVGAPLLAERYAIGTKKNVASDRNGFLPFLNAFVAGLIRDGTWARLYAQHVTPLSKDSKTAP
jgi:polar amino acid transport system substrate-binding protein